MYSYLAQFAEPLLQGGYCKDTFKHNAFAPMLNLRLGLNGLFAEDESQMKVMADRSHDKKVFQVFPVNVFVWV